VREAQVSQYNYILVVGQKEIDNNMVNVRYRDNDEKKMIKVEDLLNEFKENMEKFK